MAGGTGLTAGTHNLSLYQPPNKIKGKKSGPRTCRERNRTHAPGAGRTLGDYRQWSPAKVSPPGAGAQPRVRPGRRRAGAGAGAAPAAPSPRALHVGLEGAEADHDTLHRPQHHPDLGRHLLSAPYYSSRQPPRRTWKWRRARRPPQGRLGSVVPGGVPPLTPRGCCRRPPRPSWQPRRPASALSAGWRLPALPASLHKPSRRGPGSFTAVEGEGPAGLL